MALVLTISILIPAHRAPPISFQTSMIHRSSPESPLYNPNATPSNLSRMAAIAAKTRRTYIARHKASHSADGGGLAHPDAYTSPMTPFGIYQGEYIIRYSIGSDPPTETYGIPDTGSNLLWLQCLPCRRCYTQNIKYFDPAKSSSDSLISCNDKIYKSMTSGNLATETLTFADDTSPTQIVKLYVMVIGCGHYNIDNREGDKGAIGPPGVVGLSRSRSSLIGQLGFNRLLYAAASHGIFIFDISTSTLVDSVNNDAISAGSAKFITFDWSGIVRSSQPTRMARSVFERSLPWSRRGGTASCGHSPPSQTNRSNLLLHARNYVNIRRHRKRLCIEH
ncbi:hypothetical protein CRG98_029253 [Punica granatum]|uniref:Xylanase inhibitor N-terminal domain-containing protein n=1 Tax=Punica granatum TaxID=22663 RepID=A0A2I0J2S6_PUNGR|nr:hypothetical protein CRG98_029253 [Punica granatum]